MSASAVETMFNQTQSTRRVLQAVRDTAREESIAAVRSLEKRLAEVLDGAYIRGLPNLNKDGEPFRAARINIQNPKINSFDHLPIDGRAVLVLCEDGKIAMARRVVNEHGSYAVREPVEECEFKAEFVEAFTKVVMLALETHNQRMERSTLNYIKLREFAIKIKNAI